jgi:hypothetical protein
MKVASCKSVPIYPALVTQEARDIPKLARWLLHKSLHVCLRAQNQPHRLNCDATIGCLSSFIAMARHSNGIEKAKAKAMMGSDCPTGSAMPLNVWNVKSIDRWE